MSGSPAFLLSQCTCALGPFHPGLCCLSETLQTEVLPPRKQEVGPEHEEQWLVARHAAGTVSTGSTATHLLLNLTCSVAWFLYPEKEMVLALKASLNTLFQALVWAGRHSMLLKYLLSSSQRLPPTYLLKKGTSQFAVPNSLQSSNAPGKCVNQSSPKGTWEFPAFRGSSSPQGPGQGTWQLCFHLLLHKMELIIVFSSYYLESTKLGAIY